MLQTWLSAVCKVSILHPTSRTCPPRGQPPSDSMMDGCIAWPFTKRRARDWPRETDSVHWQNVRQYVCAAASKTMAATKTTMWPAAWLERYQAWHLHERWLTRGHIHILHVATLLALPGSYNQVETHHHLVSFLFCLFSQHPKRLRHNYTQRGRD